MHRMYTFRLNALEYVPGPCFSGVLFSDIAISDGVLKRARNRNLVFQVGHVWYLPL